MKNGIVLNGQTIELSEYQVKVLKQALEVNTPKKPKEEPVNPFEKAKAGGAYYYIGGYGKAYSDNQLSEEDLCAIDYDDATDCECLFKNGNYCQDENIMKQRSMHEILNRRLWRYGELNGYAPQAMKVFVGGYVIGINLDGNPYTFGVECDRIAGVVYFEEEEYAESAIEKVVKPFLKEYPDFKW